MSFRTVVISNRCKLDLRMNYVEVRGETMTRILLDDIDTLIIENPAISLTGCLLEALIEKKVKVVFCDSKRNPYSELIPCHGSHDSSRKIKNQIAWDEQVKGEIWTLIVKEKIRKQGEYLHDLGYETESEMLRNYIEELQFRDETNREGHAAKVYFNKLFGMEFSREQDNPTNAALNYGYSLLLSMVNREVSANGYITQLGLFHDNIYNPFNLSSDLMEPFRIIVDRIVKEYDFHSFEADDKRKVLELFSEEVYIAGTKQMLPNAIKIYVKSVFNALNEGNAIEVSFYEL